MFEEHNRGNFRCYFRIFPWNELFNIATFEMLKIMKMNEIKNYNAKKKSILLIAIALLIFVALNFYMIVKIVKTINFQQAMN